MHRESPFRDRRSRDSPTSRGEESVRGVGMQCLRAAHAWQLTVRGRGSWVEPKLAESREKQRWIYIWGQARFVLAATALGRPQRITQPLFLHIESHTWFLLLLLFLNFIFLLLLLELSLKSLSLIVLKLSYKELILRNTKRKRKSIKKI